ncbi:hypothetical protein HYALB_00008389 [Hymenoscyphus albidus]|uniref:Tat pathway signal sequence n=1 Tax=Hymenoscyphus albidus TaxID=595503 RepID=A0A9N9Q123_9HELO|nr:hypothetical protein HYALB_00008389 [Hymenoscyphus albidus]
MAFNSTLSKKPGASVFYHQVTEATSTEQLVSEYPEEKPVTTRYKNWLPIWVTVVLLILVASFASYSLHLSIKLNHALEEQRGYSTDWELVRGTAKLVQKKYTATFRTNDTADTVYIEYGPNDPKYVGEPSPEIDEAWHNLLKGQYLIISEEEAMKLNRHDLVEGLYLAEPEVMHSLHCLNAIRKSLYYGPNYTHHNPDELPKNYHKTHIDHCIEQIRQNIQCALDLTPIPIFVAGREGHRIYVGEPQVHTCRDWDSFREWYTVRGEKFGNIGSFKGS